MLTTFGRGLALDTSAAIRHLRDPSAATLGFATYEILYLPHTALAELYYGAFRASDVEQKVRQVGAFRESVEILFADDFTAQIYGRVAARLAEAGTPIPQNDIWIAASALQHGLPLATSDRHFERVAGLQVLFCE